MPTYDYRCLECGEVFEIRRSVTSADDTALCPYGHSSVARVWFTAHHEALLERGAHARDRRRADMQPPGQVDAAQPRPGRAFEVHQ